LSEKEFVVTHLTRTLRVHQSGDQYHDIQKLNVRKISIELND